MSSDTCIGALLLLFWVGIAGAIGWRVLTRVWRDHCPRITLAGKAACICLILALAAIGGDKSPAVRALATLITALRGGELLDPSGRIGAASSAAAAQAIVAASGDIIAAASNTVAEAQALFDGAAETLTNRNLQVAYLAADLPRAIANIHTNSNVAAAIQLTRQDGSTNLLAYVWYSETPAIEPRVEISYSIADGVWAYLPTITNSYPDTVDIDGIPCVEYRYEIPEPVRGIAFRPDYELSFGGARAQDYLIIPIGGIIVTDYTGEHLPYTGTDIIDETLSISYLGGIAVSANYHGTNYTGVVTL